MKKNTEKQLATITGLTAALAATSSAATVQITLTGNQFTTTGGNQFNLDITGDGVNDFTSIGTQAANAQGNYFVKGNLSSGSIFAGAFDNIGSLLYSADANFAGAGVGQSDVFSSPSPQNVKFLNHISFTDSRINGGAATQGYLEVNAFNSAPNNHSLVFTRVVFDDASTTRPVLTNSSVNQSFTEFSAVPEPSSLALLALGAGGLLTRRQRKAA